MDVLSWLAQRYSAAARIVFNFSGVGYSPSVDFRQLFRGGAPLTASEDSGRGSVACFRAQL
jgi:hypothetical protein